MADVGCRNTVFGAEAQTDPAAMKTWQTAGLHHFRIEFVHEPETEVTGVIECFDKYLKGVSTTDQLQTSLAAIASSGITEGSLFAAEGFKDLVQLK